MTTLAAVDVGSNAMRLAVGDVLANGKVNVIHTAREPIRLGQDVFSSGRLSTPIIDRTVQAIRRFRDSIGSRNVDHAAGVATSAVREAANGRDLIDRIRDETGIEIAVISGAEEARLVHLAVSRKLSVQTGQGVLVDIGGGSVEIALMSDGLLVDSRSHRLGTVRMLRVLSDERNGRERFARMVEDLASETRAWIVSLFGHNLLGLFVGTGGNVEAIGDLNGRRAGKRATSFAYIEDIDRTRAALEARRRCASRRAASDVIHWLSPLARAVLPSRLTAVFSVTQGAPRVILRT